VAFLKEQLISRWEKLDRILREKNVDVFITDEPASIQYLTGFLPDAMNPYILFSETNGKLKLIAPEGTKSPYTEVLEYCAYSVDVFQNVVENARCLLRGLLEGNFSAIGLLVNRCSGWVLQDILQHGKDIIDISQEFSNMIIIKDSREVESICRTLTLNRLAYDTVRDTAKCGMTEMELYKKISGAFNYGAETPIDFIADLVSGSRTADVGGLPTMRELQSQDIIIADLLPCWEGYYSDTTRTFFVGPPSAEQRRVYATLLEALQKGADILRPKITAEEVYAQVAGVIEEKGYGKYFPHHAGHGIGTGFFEAPYFIKNCPTTLQVGMVVTIEPGIYLPGRFGIRIENNYLITNSGCENLFKYPLDLDVFVVDNK
jgi:Xaa-Pro aminopeptidase